MTNNDLKNNQIQTSWGGVREGSGRPKGISEATKIKRVFRDHFNDDEVDDLLKMVKNQAKQRPEILKFCLEQLFGRAPQRIEVESRSTEANESLARLEVSIREILESTHREELK